jgi:error-prone DNA polymerase
MNEAVADLGTAGRSPRDKTPIRRPAYAELAVTTNFSFLHGASDPEDLVIRAKELGLAGIGIADRNSVAGVVRAHAKMLAFQEEERHRPAEQRSDFKLAVGARLVFCDETPDILAYPQDRAAWGRLTRLLSTGKRRAKKGLCVLHLPDLLEFIDGLNLIVMPPARIQADRLETLLTRLTETAPHRVWLAGTMLYRGDDHRRMARLADISSRAGVPLIAVNDVLYHSPQQRALQDVVTCIREHVTLDAAGRLLEANAERHIKSAEEMARLFRGFDNAVAETTRFLARCRFSLDELRGTEYPDETRQGYATPQEALIAFAEAGYQKRFPKGAPAHVRRALEEELHLIGKLGYAPFFLTVDEIVKYARGLEKPILCQGRGSAANSVVCYCLGITEVSPEKEGSLLFERFVSEERREPPDIDVDFEHERREEVIQHIYERYGRERAGLAATVICYRGRSAVREVGKVFGLSEDTIASLAGTLWGWSNSTVAQKNLRAAGLDPSDPRLMQVIELSQALIGAPRHLSQHVGGFVITRNRLDEVVPIENAAMEDRTVIEWEKDDLETLGLLKVDILALGMLSVLRRSFELLQSRYGISRALFIQDEDAATYKMIRRADTIGVFQIESRAQMSMLPRLAPKEFYDLVIEVAIVRPGPIQGNMVHPYLKRREGREPVVYPSPALRDILGKTLGVPLFQEQAMRIAIVGAGFQPGEADRLRRAMATFKRVGTINTFRDKFIDGMTSRNYSLEFAESCWRQIEGFGSYGFPESHAASFANLVYASAWIKCHYPDVFATALLNSQPMGFYAPAQIARDAREHGVDIRPVDINHSDWDCTLEPDASDPRARINKRHIAQRDDIRSTHALRLGLRQISGFSEDWARAIERARGKGFDSVRDLWLRTGLKPAALEKLAQADAFRSLGLSRREALWAVKALRRAGDKDDLPLFARAAMPQREPDIALPPMPPGQQVIEDYRHLHLSLKAHPVSFLRRDLDARGVIRHDRLADLAPGRRVTIAGLVLVRQRPGQGNAIFITLEDETAIANVIVWPRKFEEYRPIILGSRLIGVTGALQNEKGVIHVVADEFADLSPLLSRLSERADRIDTLLPADRAKSSAPPDPRAHPRRGDSLVRLLRERSPDATALRQTERVLPKGRNFH